MARGRAKSKTKKIKYFDYTLLFLIIFLLCFGLVMLYSASSYTAAKKYMDAAYWVKRQLVFACVGVGAMFIVSFIDYHIYRYLAVPAYFISFVLCCLVFTKLGDSANNSTRWVELGPVRFQPSEIAKIAVIIFLAVMIEKIPRKMDDWRTLIKLFIFLTPIIGIVASANLSTAVIIAGIAVCIMFVSTQVYKPFLLLAGIGGAGGWLFIKLAGYRAMRIKAWLHPEEVSGDLVFQTWQGLYAIGSGGLFGKGLGESMQKKFVPEAQNDMIFTIVCEELGLFGGVCIILLYGLLIWRMLVIANNAKDLLGSLLVAGVMSHISLQVVMNIAVATNSMPNTGVTLPFISYGGTSLMLLLAEMGIVLSVSRGIVLEKIE